MSSSDLLNPLTETYLLGQAYSRFIASPAYLASIAFLQNPSLTVDSNDSNSDELYYEMVASVDLFLQELNQSFSYSPNLPVTIQLALPDGTIQYSSSSTKPNTIPNVLAGNLGTNLSSRPEFTLSVLQHLLQVEPDSSSIVPSPYVPLPIPGNLFTLNRFSNTQKIYKNFLCDTFVGKFLDNTGYSYFPFGVILLSIPMTITGYPLPSF
jgi:hypothetical protein